MIPARPRALALSLCLSTWLAPSLARANGTHLPDVVDVLLLPGDETTIAIEADFGLLESREGGPFHWICHETIVTFPGLVPTYAASSDGVWLASVRLLSFGIDPDETVYRSTDACSWSAVSGLTGVAVSSIAFDPSDPSRAFASSANAGGAMNAVWFSADGGATWTKTALEVDHYVNAVRLAAADPLTVWATSSDPSEALAFVHRSTDGGVAWTTHPWTEFPEGFAVGSLAVIATAATDASVAWVRSYGLPHRLWLTTNGGSSFTPVMESAGIRDAEDLGDGRVWVATVTSGAWLSLDGGRTFAATSTEPRPRGFARDARGLFAATDPYLDPFALVLSTGGDPRMATGLFRFDDLAGPKPCPPGSAVSTTCTALWPSLQVRLGLLPGRIPEPVSKSGDGTSNDANDESGAGCSCSTVVRPAHPLAALVLAALGLILLRRVRQGSMR